MALETRVKGNAKKTLQFMWQNVQKHGLERVAVEPQFC